MSLGVLDSIDAVEEVCKREGVMLFCRLRNSKGYFNQNFIRYTRLPPTLLLINVHEALVSPASLRAATTHLDLLYIT